MRRLALLLAAVLALPLVTARVAHAQWEDDWEVKRDPFDKQVIARYKGILKKNPHDSGALAKLLSMYRRYRSVELLENEYKKQLDSKPSDFSTLVVLGRLRMGQGDEGGALTYFEQAAASKSDDPGLLVELGALYRNSGKIAEARTAFDTALANTKNKDVKKKALRALADLALGANDIEGAKGYFDKYLALEPKNLQLRIELGDALLQAGKHDEAIEAYKIAEKGMKSDPSRRVDVVMRIARAHQEKGADVEAIAEYKRAIKVMPMDYIEVEVTAKIIDIYRTKQELPILLAEYEQSWPVKKRGHFEWYTLATLYTETGSQDKAIEAYKKAVAKAPYELNTQSELIKALTNAGRLDDAIKQYEAVVKEAPGDARFQLELARRYADRGDLDKALALLKKIDGNFRSDPGVQASLAELYNDWNKPELALAAYERLAKLEPGDYAHLIVLGEQHWMKGDKTSQDKALVVWKRIAALKTAEAYAKLGDVLANHQMPVDALAHYAKAIKLEPKNTELYKGRAAIYEGEKQWAEAMGDWEMVMSLLGDKPADRAGRREARRRIVAVLTRAGNREAEYRNKWLAAFKKNPADIEAGHFLVEYYDRRPQAGEPKGTLEKLRKLTPEDQEVITDLVKAYRNSRELDKAVEQLLELEKIAPHRKREVYTQISEIKTEARKDDEAIEWAKKAVEISTTGDATAWQRLAERYVDMQRIDEAIAAYVKALEIDKTAYKASFALADLYIQSSQPARAAQLFHDILKAQADDETLLKAGRAAIDLEEMTGTLGALEKVVSPLSFQNSHKPVYRKVLVDLYLRYVPVLVHHVRHGDATERKAARAELDRLGQHGLQPLLEALSDQKDVNQQRGAVSVLGHLGNPGAAGPLVRLARTEPKVDDAARRIGTLQQSLDWEVRVEALVAAGRLGNANVLGDVLTLAKHDEVAMREAAVFTIGRTRDKRAVAPLIAALDDRRESVQALACLGLAQIEDKTGVKAMIDVVADAKRHDLARGACAWALGVRKAIGASAALSAALVDNRGEAQRLAAWALAQIGDKKALPDVIRAYFTRDDAAREVLGWALAHLAGAAAVAPTDDISDYPLRNGKFHTATAIGRLGGELPATGSVSSVVVGNETAIAEGIQAALGEHRDMVLAMLGDLDARSDGLSLGNLVPVGGALDAKLVKALDTIGAAIAKDVTAHLTDDDPKVAAVALSVAAKIDAAGVDDAIARAITADASLVRQAAIRAVVTVAQLRGSAPAALRTALAARVAKGEWQDRRAAAHAIGELGAAADVDALIGALGDDSSFVREAACDSLGKLRATKAVDALITVSSDEVPAVRRAAAAALVAIGDGRAKARLADLAENDPDPAVQEAARGH